MFSILHTLYLSRNQKEYDEFDKDFFAQICLRVILHSMYRVSRKKVYPFAGNLANIKYKDLTHNS